MGVDSLVKQQVREEINAMWKGGKGGKGGGGKGGGGKGGAGKGAPKGTTSTQKPCNCCGKTGHWWADCRHKDQECSNCGTKGHLKVMCRSKGGGAHDLSLIHI